MLHCTIHFLAGGSYCDIRRMASISKASFYHLVWHTIFTINHCAVLDIKLPSDSDEINSTAKGGDSAMNGCVGSLDGFLLRIKASSQEKCGGNVSTYYSGHCYCYRVNVQTMCNSKCCFSVAAPWKTNDARAIKKLCCLLG
jgi:hypothetical protein